MYFVLICGFIALVGYFSTLYQMFQIGEDSLTILDRFFAVLVIAVPPALPTAMSSGVAFAISRLRVKQIFCIQPNRLNLAGHINWVVFDKTGTITEEGLTAMGVEACEDA